MESTCYAPQLDGQVRGRQSDTQRMVVQADVFCARADYLENVHVEKCIENCDFLQYRVRTEGLGPPIELAGQSAVGSLLFYTNVALQVSKSLRKARLPLCERRTIKPICFNTSIAFGFTE